MKARTKAAGAIVATIALPLLAAASAVAQVKIVTTTPDMAALAEHVGGELVEVESIATGRQNLHAIQAKPSYMLQARDADLWIRVGLQMEIGYERPLLQGARNRDIMEGRPGHLDASASIDPLEIPGASLVAAAGLTYGDVHPLGNPHYWLDPANAKIVTRSIADRLSRLDPANAARYDANQKAFAAEIDSRMFGKELVEAVGAEPLWSASDDGGLEVLLAQARTPPLAGWMAKMAPLRDKKVVTYHRSWVYFSNRFGIEVVEHVEPKPGIPPSPRHVANAIELMKREGVKIILMEPFYSPQAPERMARETGAQVVIAALSVGGQEGVDDYFGLIDNIVNRLVEAFDSTRE
jgi:ABC-type Zn uptake system ZnuABC Zn-binding protein ZnuA